MAKKAGKIALGLGLLTGAITGLLFAPEEGKKIREKIAKGDGKGLLTNLKAMGQEIGDMVQEVANRPSVLEAIDNAKDKAATAANIQRKELDAMLKAAHTKAEQFRKGVEAYVKEQKTLLDEKFGEKKKVVKKAKAVKAKQVKAKAAAKPKAKPAPKAVAPKKAPAKKKKS